MTEKDFISNFRHKSVEQETVRKKCSSNIALIKYWGKYDPQLPANSSISYTLTNSFTETEIQITKSDNFSVEIFLNKEKQESFAKKIEKYFKKIEKYLPFILNYKYSITTYNSFPHSSGIASSASGFGAIALCLMEISEKLGENLTEDFKFKKASFLARLGSGSACRSIYKGLVIWGENKKIPESSNLYAVTFPFEIHPIFKKMNDTILLIHEGKKNISSTVGHSLMNNHPYAEARFKEAQTNLANISEILQNGDIKAFGQIVEHEALTLHSMMLSSNPPFILMKPGTISVIEKIWKYRELTNNNLYFTLDAGANIHLIYPKEEEKVIFDFIKNDLLKYTENGKLIMDEVLF